MEIDLAGNIMFANLNSFIAFRYTKKDLHKGLNIFQTIAPEDHERAKRNIQKYLKGQRSDGKEYTGVRKDGSRFLFTAYMTQVLHKSKPVGFRAILIDVTERKQMEESLAKSEERYRLLFNNISDAVFVHEFTSDKLPGRFIEVNDIACKYLGYSRDELLRMSPIDIDAPEGYALVPAMMELLQAHKHATWEGIHVSKDGTENLSGNKQPSL